MRLRLLLATATAVLVTAAAASTASASFIYTRGNQTENDYVIAGTITLGEVNNITVSQFTSGGTLYYNFVENGGSGISSFDDRCTRATANVVYCPADSEGVPWHVDAELHDGDDSITMNTTRPGRIEGGAGTDVLKGGSADDVMIGDGDNDGHDGNDVIDGRGGADHIVGDGGTDTVSYASRSTPVNVSLDGTANDGGSGEGDLVGPDVENIAGSQGADTLTGDDGPNRIDGNGGADTISGLGQDDTLGGGTESDAIDGGAGNDTMTGDTGGETLVGGLGNDTMNGGDDGDDLVGGPGADDMTAGTGFDIVDYAGVTAPLSVTVADNVANDGAAGEGDNVRPGAEEILGGEGNDKLSLRGTSPRGELFGRGGNDTLTGGNSNDLLEGQEGNDTLEGSYGADRMNGDAGVDTVDYRVHSYTDLGTGDVVGVSSTPDAAANDGNDLIDRSDDGSGDGDNVGSDVENLLGSDGPDTLVGTLDANKLTGGAGGDTLDGADGNDTLDGGMGPDRLDGGPDTDTVTYASRSAPLRVKIDNVANDGEAGEGDDVRTTVENLAGGSGADVLTGSGQANSITGGEGDDVLDGGAGQDTLDGRGGTDTITYSGRNARVAVILDGKRNDGADPDGNGSSGTIEEGDKDLGIENATGGAAGDTLRAPAKDAVRNFLRGLGGDDTLNTREGSLTVDTLDCGPGAGDRFAKDPSDGQTGCEVALP
jgi:Ca2+-binding RTX toxin-like protein